MYFPIQPIASPLAVAFAGRWAQSLDTLVRPDAALYRDADTRQSKQNQIAMLWIEYSEMTQLYAEIFSEVIARKRIAAAAINRVKNDLGSLQQISVSEIVSVHSVYRQIQTTNLRVASSNLLGRAIFSFSFALN